MGFDIKETVLSVANAGAFGTTAQAIARSQNPPPVDVGRAPPVQAAPTPPNISQPAPLWKSPVAIVGAVVVVIIAVVFFWKK